MFLSSVVGPEPLVVYLIPTLVAFSGGAFCRVVACKVPSLSGLIFTGVFGVYRSITAIGVCKIVPHHLVVVAEFSAAGVSACGVCVPEWVSLVRFFVCAKRIKKLLVGRVHDLTYKKGGAARHEPHRLRTSLSKFILS